MSSANKYQPFTTDDIFRYLEGKMSSAEMRRLELAALDDPFLQDAIDGFRLEFEKNSKDKMLPYLAEAMSQRSVVSQEPARVIPFFRMGAFKWAVAAMLIIGSGLLWFNLNVDNQQPEANENTAVVLKENLADSSPTGDVALTSLPKTPGTNETDQIGNKSAAPEESIATNINRKKSSTAAIEGNNADKDKEESNDDLTKTDAGVLANRPAANAGTHQLISGTDSKFEKSSRFNRFDSGIIAASSKPSVQKPPMLKETLSGKVSGVSINENIAANSRSSFSPNFTPNELPGKMSAPQTHYLAGKTIDKEKFPLDHIVITVKGDTTRTVSDEMGRFSLQLPDSVATLVASGIGFKTKEFNINSNKGKVELELTPAETSLSEVVISGYSRQKKNRSQEIVLDLDTTEASPAGGWKNFERYVMENRKIKPGKNKTAIVLSIEIEESGKVGDVEVIESGGNLLDREALRLLKDGPKWINKTKQKVAFAKVTIVL